MTEYRVNLEVYNGPLDLLLEIKTRMLLPTAPPEEGGPEGLEIDPRAELVRQLLEYKAFKDAAGELGEAAELHAQRFPRAVLPPDADGEAEFDLEDAQVWDLLDAFSKMMASIGASLRDHQVIYDDTPVELHAADILDRLQNEGPMTFRRIFEGRTHRVEIVGLFLALLELVRRKKILARQEGNFGEIHVHLNPNPPAEDQPPQEGEYVAETSQGKEDAKRQADIGRGAAVEGGAETTSPQDGQYVAQAPPDAPQEAAPEAGRVGTEA